jgi:hypothetical protein
MEIDPVVLVTVACMWISYTVGTTVGNLRGYHNGFIQGASDGIDKLVEVLKKDYGLDVVYAVPTITTEEEDHV